MQMTETRHVRPFPGPALLLGVAVLIVGLNLVSCRGPHQLSLRIEAEPECAEVGHLTAFYTLYNKGEEPQIVRREYIDVPWQESVTINRGGSVSFLATAGEDCGQLECQILLDGRQVVRNVGVGKARCAYPR